MSELNIEFNPKPISEDDRDKIIQCLMRFMEDVNKIEGIDHAHVLDMLLAQVSCNICSREGGINLLKDMFNHYLCVHSHKEKKKEECSDDDFWRN